MVKVKRLIALLLVAAALCPASADAADLDTGRKDLQIRSPNVLMEGVQKLGDAEGWVIDYEAVEPLVPGLPDAGAQAVGVQIEYGDGDEREEVLKQLMQGRTNDGGRYEYRVVRRGHRVQVVPSRMRDEQSGEWRSLEPLLDTPISLSAQQAPATDLIHEIVAQVDAQRDEEFVAGVLYPRGWQVSVPTFDRVPAREALEWVLDRIPPNGRLAWRIQPWNTGEGEVHALSIVAVCPDGQDVCRPEDDAHAIWVTPTDKPVSE